MYEDVLKIPIPSLNDLFFFFTEYFGEKLKEVKKMSYKEKLQKNFSKW